MRTPQKAGAEATIAGTNGGTLTWDANGNLTSDGATPPTNYAYDTE